MLALKGTKTIAQRPCSCSVLCDQRKIGGEILPPNGTSGAFYEAPGLLLQQHVSAQIALKYSSQATQLELSASVSKEK